jgi:hypothetical protein
MTQRQTGWVVFAAACGMMLGMLSVDVASLMNWGEIRTPVFVGTTLGHVGAVIMAFVGGNLIPEKRDPEQRTRASD